MYRKTVDELQNDQREKLVIDIRSEEDYTKETYPGAKHIFWETFMDHIGEIPKDQPVYLFCYTGQRSDEIAEELSDKGYEIYSIEGGYRSYLRKKLADFMKEDDGTAERLADKAADAERSIIKKFKKTVWRPFTKAINAYEMIQDGDKIAVCISGGKDSMLMAKLFQELERHGKKNFEVVFLVTFQALATAIAAQVGTGNIIGASGAILTGGPGAIFWMWVIAFFGMATIYAEATLAQKTRIIDKDGTVHGGPVYYITTAFKGGFGKFLAGFFAVAIILALGLMGMFFALRRYAWPLSTTDRRYRCDSS